jgi:hypothetical protein
LKKLVPTHIKRRVYIWVLNSLLVEILAVRIKHLKNALFLGNEVHDIWNPSLVLAVRENLLDSHHTFPEVLYSQDIIFKLRLFSKLVSCFCRKGVPALVDVLFMQIVQYSEFEVSCLDWQSFLLCFHEILRAET